MAKVLKRYDAYPSQVLAERLHTAAQHSKPLLLARGMGRIAAQYGDADLMTVTQVVTLTSSQLSPLAHYVNMQDDELRAVGEIWARGKVRIREQNGLDFARQPSESLAYISGWTNDDEANPAAAERLTGLYHGLAALALSGGCTGVWTAERVNAPPETLEAIREAGFTEVARGDFGLRRADDDWGSNITYDSVEPVAIFVRHFPDQLAR